MSAKHTPGPADFFTTHRGPLGVNRVCKLCKHSEFIVIGNKGAGRGYGMREGNKARGRMIQHIKTAHAAALAKARGE